MITQDALDAAQSIFYTAYQAYPDFSTIEILTYWPDPQYNPNHDLFILHEGDEADALITLGGTVRSTPTGNGTQYVPDWLKALYWQRPVAQQPGMTVQLAQQHMRLAKTILRDIFKVQPGVPQSNPQNVNLNGTVALAGQMVKIVHPPAGPYYMVDGSVVLRHTFEASISIRSSEH